MAEKVKIATELKPCPFCGGKAEMWEAERPDPPVHYGVAYVKCQTCGCNTGDYVTDGYYGAETTMLSAVEAWNKTKARTTEIMTDDEIDAFNRLDSMMYDGYIDINQIFDEDEFNLISKALKEYKKNHTMEDVKNEKIC